MKIPTLRPTWKQAVRLYRQGNQALAAGKAEDAQRLWQASESAHSRPAVPEPPPPLLNMKVVRFIAVRAVAVITCFYLILFAAFPRQDDPFLMMLGGGPPGQERSAWDQFWDSGRPSHDMGRYLGTRDLWPSLRQSLEELLGQEDGQQQGGNVAQQLLERWLRQSRDLPAGVPLREVDYYALAGRGLSTARQFDEAIATFQEGLMHAENARQLGNLHQEIGTSYYYQGYHLQPDGLADYDLQLVRKSAEAYEEASAYSSSPYLFGNLGWSYYLLGEYQKSIENSKRALAIDPSLNYVRMNLGITYLRMHDYEATYQAYEGILRFNPDGLEYEGGIRDLKELEREFPGRYPFLEFVLGFIYLKQERYALAREHLQAFTNQSFPERYWQDYARHLMATMGSQRKG